MVREFDGLMKRHLVRFTDEAIASFERGEIGRAELSTLFQDAMESAALGIPLFWLLILRGQSPDDMDELLAHVGLEQEGHAQSTARRVEKRRAEFTAIDGGKGDNEIAPAGGPTGAND